MTEPLLALQVKPIDMPTYRDIMQQRDEYRTQQNTLAQQQLKQQQNAMLNQAYAEAYDPQTGRVDTNKLYGRLAQGGMGAEIPGQMEAYGKAQEATGKGSSEQFKHAQEILTVSRNELGNARTPQEAMAAGLRIAQQYPEAADGIRQSLVEVQNMSPEQFGAWKMGAIRKNLTAAQQLQQHFVQQNLGGSMREIATPEYGTGPATVVPGSEAQVTMTPQQQYAAQNPAGKVVQDDQGNYVVVNTRVPGPVMAGGGGIPTGRGGAVDPTAFKAAIIQKESGGDYTALSPKGALGAYQVMPATAKTLAGRLGLPWNPDLMRNNTPQGRQYQDAIGNAAVQEAWQAGNGDVGRAAAYYHGGSDESQWKGKTQAYARDIVASLGNGAPAPAAGGGQLRGPTKGKPAAAAPAATETPKKTDPEMVSAVQHLYDLVQEAHRKGHITANDQSWVANRLQEATVDRPYLPGGTAQKTSLDSIDKTAKQIMRLSIKPGTSGTLRAVAEQQMFLQSVGGGDATYETRLDAVREFAKQHGIPLPNDRKNAPAAGRTTTGDPEMDAIMRKHGGKN